jgi:hypothetical protein
MVCGLVVGLLASCGNGGSDTPDARLSADAAEPADAGPKVYCYDEKTDSECGYTSESLLPSEITLADQLTLAQRFNPAQVMTGDDVWPISVAYALVEGEPLMKAEHDGRINFTFDIDMGTVALAYGNPQPDLTAQDFRILPIEAANEKGLVYFLDLPGTSTGPGHDDENWTDGWRAAQGYDDPTTVVPTEANYPPSQYAHLFWLSKADDLLAIQYWFFYPYDKFANNHEGDWEHVNVVLDYENPEAPFIAFVHFSNHGRQVGRLAEDLYRIADTSAGDGDHVVVFAGGDACLLTDEWCGDTSGASFPYPGVYKLSYDETVAGTSDRAGRNIHANDINVMLLPRFEDVTSVGDPNITWYGMPFLFGEPITAQNAPVAQATKDDRAPVGPIASHPEYDAGIEEWAYQLFRDGDPAPFDKPEDWTFINEPPASTFE